MLGSSICVSVSSRLRSFIKKTIFKLAEQNRSVLPPSSAGVCRAFIMCLWFTDAKYTCREKRGGQTLLPSQGVCCEIFLTLGAVLHVNVHGCAQMKAGDPLGWNCSEIPASVLCCWKDGSGNGERKDELLVKD